MVAVLWGNPDPDTHFISKLSDATIFDLYVKNEL